MAEATILGRKREEKIVLGHWLLRRTSETKLDSVKEARLKTGIYRHLTSAKILTDLDSALYFNNRGLSYVKAAKSNSNIHLLLLNQRYDIYRERPRGDSAVYWLDSLLRTPLLDENPTILGWAYSAKSRMLADVGKVDSAQQFLFTALEVLKKDSISALAAINGVRAGIYHKLAFYNRQHGDTDLALDNYRTALSYTSFLEHKAQIFHSVGMLFLEQMQFDSALHYAKLCHQSANTTYAKRRAFDVMTWSHLRRNEIADAVTFRDSLYHLENVRSPTENANPQRWLNGVMLNGQGRFAASAEVLREQMAENISPRLYVDYLRPISRLVDEGTFNKHLDTLQFLIVKEKDRLSGTDIQASRVKYETEQQELRNQLLEEEKRSEQARGHLYLAGGGGVALLALALGIGYLTVRRRNDSLAIAKTEIDRLRKASIHATQGNFRNISFSLDDALEDDSLDGETKSYLAHLGRQVKGFYELQRLTQVDDDGYVDLPTYFRQLQPHYEASLLDDGATLRLLVIAPPLRIKRKAARLLGITLNELVTNSGKYANRVKGKVPLTVLLEELPVGGFRMFYSDTGTRAEIPDTIPSTQLGRSTITGLMRQLSATVLPAEGYDYIVDVPANWMEGYTLK